MWYGPNGEAPKEELIDDEYIESGFSGKKKPMLPKEQLLHGPEGRQLYLSRLENTLELVTREKEKYQKLYLSVDEDREKARKDLIMELVIFVPVILLYACFFIDSCAGFLMGSASGIPFFALSILLMTPVGVYVRATVRKCFRYRILSRGAEPNAYVEKYRMRTFYKDEEYYRAQMTALQERVDSLKAIRAKMQSGEDPDSEEAGLLISSRALCAVPPNPYKNEYPHLSDYLKTMLGK